MASLIEMLTGGNKFDLYRKKAENPTAHENIDKLILNNELSPEIQKVIQTAIMGGVGGPAGSLKGLTQLIKSKGGKETLKKIMPDSKNVIKFIEDMNKKSIKNLSKQKQTKRFYSEYGDDVLNKFIKESQVALTNEGRNALNKALREGLRGQKAINKAFVQRPDGSYFIKPTASKIDDLVTTAATAIATKNSNKKILSNMIPLIGLLAAGGTAGYTASKANKEYNLSNNFLKMLRPDPNMGTKEQHDKDMEMIIKTMSPEAQLKYLKNTGQGYPADEGMFLRAEPENTNEILLQLLGE